MEKASGGDLSVDEEYTLLPSEVCLPGRDNGAVVLKKLVQAHPNSSPMVTLSGYACNLHHVPDSDIGFKRPFLW